MSVLQRRLSGFDVLLLTISCLSPMVSILAQGGDVLAQAGSGAVGLFGLGLCVAVVWALVYGELGAAYPAAGGEYVGVGACLGGWAGFASLSLWGLTAGPISAVLAQTMGKYGAVLWPGLPHGPVVLGYAGLAAAGVVALLAVRISTVVTGICLAVELLAVAGLAVAGFWHWRAGAVGVVLHPVHAGAAGLVAPGFAAVALSAVSAAYATTGGNQAVAFGEELVDPHRRMAWVILIAGVVGALCTALPVMAVVVGAPDLVGVLRSPVPFSAFVVQLGGGAAGIWLSVAVVVALFNALAATLMFYARLVFSLGRDGIFPQALNRLVVRVDGGGVPREATWVLLIGTAFCAAVPGHALIVFTSALTVYSLALVSAAVWRGRLRGLTGRAGMGRTPLFPMVPLLGLMLAAGFLVADLLDADAGRPGVVILGALLALGQWWHWQKTRVR